MQLSEQFTCFGVLNYGIEHDVDLSFAGRYDIDYVKFEIPDTGEYNPEFNTQTHKKAQ